MALSTDGSLLVSTASEVDGLLMCEHRRKKHRFVAQRDSLVDNEMTVYMLVVGILHELSHLHFISFKVDPSLMCTLWKKNEIE